MTEQFHSVMCVADGVVLCQRVLDLYLQAPFGQEETQFILSPWLVVELAFGAS